MKKQIKRISIAQTSKIVAILYVIFGLIYSVIGIPMILLGRTELKVMGFMYLFMPFIMGVFGFIFVAIGCWIYNLVASKFGGIEFEVEDMDYLPNTDLPA